MTSPDRPDIFGSESLPAVSWKNAPIGTVQRFLVESHPELVQSRDYETRQPAFWPDGNPKYSAVLKGKLGGEERSLWVDKPSAMFAAIGEAQKLVGRPVAPGDTLVITYTHDEPNKQSPHLNPAKQFKVVIEAGSAFGAVNGTTAAPAAAVTPATQPAVATAPVSASVKMLTPEQYASLAQAGVDMTPFAIAGVSA